MAGELNAKHIEWTTRLTTVRGKVLRDYADRHSCLIYGPDSSTPDVIYRHNQRPSIPVHLTACSALTSDHLPILIDAGRRSFFLNVHDRLDFRWTDWKTQMGGACGTYGGEAGAHRVFVVKSERRRPVGKPKLRWETNIKVDLQEVVWGAWTGSIWLRIRTGGGLLWMR
jgi:hypothetical protein